MSKKMFRIKEELLPGEKQYLAVGLVPSCQEAGVLGALAGVIGVLQAVEAIKLILSKGDSLAGYRTGLKRIPLRILTSRRILLPVTTQSIFGQTQRMQWE